jgi:hypothetical protein
MARRQCRYIVIGDASDDPERGFEDLGNAIRKIRIDLGAEIKIKLGTLQLKQDEKDKLKKSESHYAIGKIIYPQKPDGTKLIGTLLYIKPSLCNEMPGDVFSYALRHGDFPYQKIGNQLFDGAQFESYRKLGIHSIQHLMQLSRRPNACQNFENDVEDFFASLC